MANMLLGHRSRTAGADATVEVQGLCMDHPVSLPEEPQDPCRAWGTPDVGGPEKLLSLLGANLVLLELTAPDWAPPQPAQWN